MYPIEDFDGYFITEDGMVWSDKTHRFLKPELRKGYLSVLLYRDRKAHHTPIHRLVAHAFVKGEFEGAVVNHLDGDKLHNHSSNLEWTTVAGNTIHAYSSGLIEHHKGSTKLTELMITEIRKNPDRLSQAKLAKIYGISQSTISRIILQQLTY